MSDKAISDKELFAMMSPFSSQQIAEASGLGVDSVHAYRSMAKTGRQKISPPKSRLLVDACAKLVKQPSSIPDTEAVSTASHLKNIPDLRHKGSVATLVHSFEYEPLPFAIKRESEIIPVDIKAGTDVPGVAHFVDRWLRDLPAHDRPRFINVDNLGKYYKIYNLLSGLRQDGLLTHWSKTNLVAINIHCDSVDVVAQEWADSIKGAAIDKPQGFLPPYTHVIPPHAFLETEQPPRDEWTICRELVALLRELRNASKSQVLFENLVQSVSEK